jgi:hypothetical protein
VDLAIDGLTNVPFRLLGPSSIISAPNKSIIEFVSYDHAAEALDTCSMTNPNQKAKWILNDRVSRST